MTQLLMTDAPQRNLLIQQYKALSTIEQTIVRLLSVIYEPVSRSSLLLCLSQVGLRDRNGKAFISQTIKPDLDRLIQKGLLVQQGGQGIQCHPLLAEVATRDAVQTGQFKTIAKAVQEKLPVVRRWGDGPSYFSGEGQLVREVRIGIYRHDLKFIHKQIEDYAKYSYAKDRISIEEIYLQVCNNPFDKDWFCKLPKDIYESALFGILARSRQELIPADEAFSLFQADCNQKECSDTQRIFLIEQLILRGNLSNAQQQIEWLSEPSQSNAAELQGWLFFLIGEDEKAIEQYTYALQLLKKSSGKRKVHLQSIAGLFFILALLKDGSAQRVEEAADYANAARQPRHGLNPVYERLERLAKVQQGDLAQKAALMAMPIAPPPVAASLDTLFGAMCLYWVDAEEAKRHLPRLLKPLYQQAKAGGYDWLAMEAAELLSQMGVRGAYGKEAAALRHGTQSIASMIQPQEAWELSLKALVNLHQEPQPAADRHLRLAWFITFYPSGCVIQPREQSLNAKGDWSKGRPIALKRLQQTDNFSYLTPQDLRVCAQITIRDWQMEYVVGERAIVELIGHPLAFWEDAPTTRIDVVKGEPELLVKKKKDDWLILQFVPEPKDKKDIYILKETPTRLKVIEITPEHRQIIEILGKSNRLEVPASAKERVLAAINAISGMVTVHSDIGGGVANAEPVPADPKPHIHLLPAGGGLKVAVLARPFAHGGSYYRPGTGGETVIAEIDGKRLQTTRDLKEEKRLAKGAIESCPTLSQSEAADGEWLIEEPEDCLELLLELQELGEMVVLEWLEGEKLRVSHQAGLQDFQLSIKRQNDWFATDGKLKLDNDSVLDMQRLMELLDQTSSRFIPLGNNQFLALTQEFRKRLDELRAFSEKSGKGWRVHPLAALALEDWIEDVGSLKADKYWQEHTQRLKDIQTLDPIVPSTLQAELRDYQIDGFRWIARLAHWGVGACLADDMGLGKTLQALAVILTRAPNGATLIVAPTSVGMNWVGEAERFAPTLNVLQFGGGDRQKMLDNLQPFDMVVCSYGLLQQEDVAEMLAKVSWQTIVLDEAQSIKNFATKRSQAAMNLQGGFKLITTGTPIENHLGELWNLFRFINPGLLGSIDHFNQRFAVPIERYGDKQARNQLKKLIQPFLLRRTKSQVLQELPSRTEILLHVDLSQEEKAFYEALRQKAISKLADSDAAAGAKHLQVLAEIMKLRRACCNARLVTPDLTLPSSKLHLFGEVLGELLDNHHKALVFSQFVDHLRLIRDYLDRQKISYQYLDGSTPAKDRKRRVDAFQAGEGDVFLISLKAGGTGLNLTAADYVIHMDPWWNPAVEDQASDRAHRIGQHRPVTIYRLVAKGTIEEKIVDLHQHKRDLADSLLEGTEMSGKVSTDELLRLIQAG